MRQDKVKALRAENRRLQCSVAKLAETNEIISLKMKQQEDALAKRRSEVATLHQACAKNKRARIVCAQRLRHLTIRTPTSHAATQPIIEAPTIEAPTIETQETINKKQRTLADDSTANETTPNATPAGDENAERSPPPPQENQTVCVRCQKMQAGCLQMHEGLRELSAGHDRFSQLIEEVTENTKQRYAQQKREASEILERTIREMAESERRRQQRIEQQLLVISRRRNGCANAG